MVSTIACRLAIFIVLAAAPRAALAQAVAVFPNKPIRFLSPAVPGAGNDTTTRAIAQKLTQAWGQQVIVDYRR